MKKIRKNQRGATFIELAIVFSVIIFMITAYSIIGKRINENTESRYFAAAGTLNRIMAEKSMVTVSLAGNILPSGGVDYNGTLEPILKNLEDASKLELCLAAVKKTATSLILASNNSILSEDCELPPHLNPNLCGSDNCLIMFPYDPNLRTLLPPVLTSIAPKPDASPVSNRESY